MKNALVSSILVLLIIGVAGTASAASLSISDVTEYEPFSDTTDFLFLVTLSETVSGTVTVDWATADGTAIAADGDYVSTSGQLTFDPGVQIQTITVTVNDDNIYEPTETFTVNISNATNATITDSIGLGTILNVDSQPGVSISSLSAVHPEGNSGTKPFTFEVILSHPSSLLVVVDWLTVDITALVADGDYVSESGQLTFDPGVLSRIITVMVNGDNIYEDNETFGVALNIANNAIIEDSTEIGTILDDEGKPQVSISSLSAVHPEGNSGTKPFTFEVIQSHLNSFLVTVDWLTVDLTAVAADGDYVSASGQLTFDPGIVSRIITVTVNGDNIYEDDETFGVALEDCSSKATLLTVGAIGEILNDDNSIPTLSDWGMIIFFILLVGSALWIIRRRTSQKSA